MANIGGKHHQTLTKRELTYWCAYVIVDATDLAYVAVISEGLNHLGQREATLRYDPTGIPAKDLVRMDMLKHLDRTSFEDGEPPDARWIGWYGPFL